VRTALPPAVAVRTRTLVSAPVTFQCGVNALVNVSSPAVDTPSRSRFTVIGMFTVNGWAPVSAADGIVVFRIRL
jgi:hypothetical protein